jgi:tRNA-dihydrouridine synthase A
MNAVSHKFCVAPMLDKTDRHYRYFVRLLTRHALLYTEMITTGAILKGDRDYQLRYHPSEHPVALQLGGSEPGEMRECALIARDYGYDEVNINVGCPSDRVQSGLFGACLMARPELVAECVARMNDAVDIPITVKNRIGIDDQDSYEALHYFVDTVSQAGCSTFIIHARKAWLQGLSPKENREIPPLSYETVYRLKSDFPGLEVIINGGITTLEQSQEHLKKVDGIMIGREAYDNVYMLSRVDQTIFAEDSPTVSRKTALIRLLPYIENELQQGTRLHHITRHILTLFQGVPGARQWRRQLSAHPPMSFEALENLINQLPDQQ